jgi:hypothetical protein
MQADQKKPAASGTLSSIYKQQQQQEAAADTIKLRMNQHDECAAFQGECGAAEASEVTVAEAKFEATIQHELLQACQNDQAHPVSSSNAALLLQHGDNITSLLPSFAGLTAASALSEELKQKFLDKFQSRLR